MPTNPNMVAIQTVTVGSGGAASISFTNIPQTYTDLVLKLSARSASSGAEGVNLKINSITTGYTSRFISGNGSSAGSGTRTTYQGWDIASVVNYSTTTSSTFAPVEVYIPNYTSSNAKSASSESVQETNATLAYMYMTAHSQTSTAAITDITLTIQDASNFVQYSTATLYGVTSSAYGAKATGGIITSDANYYYHTFLASGTFTPTQNLTADYLVVAGGGGGGSEQGSGGGGGGGIQTSTAYSVTSGTGYTVTVGAGGTATANANGGNGSSSVFDSITAGGGLGGAKYSAAGGNSGTPQSKTGGTAGTPSANAETGGGGAGAGANGGNATTSVSGGTGGAGIASTYSGTSINYGGGGGGGGATNTTAGNGTDGGGNGATSTSTNGSAGTANRGGGGGGTRGATTVTGGAGGSGIVIVRYAK